MAAETFAILVVEPGRAKLTRFNVELRGETLWATSPVDLARYIARGRPELVAVAGDTQVAVELADELRRRGLARSVFLITPAEEEEEPLGPGRTRVSLPVEYGEMEPAELLLCLVRAMVSAQARTPVSGLTGLPGSPVLRDDVERRLAAGESFVFLYLDVDNFKAYNDVYGFGRGDIVIRALAREVVQATRAHGSATDLCVHIGGDDFAVVTASDNYTEIARRITAGFASKVPEFYDEQARARQYIETPSRRGEPTRYPLMTVSIGGVNPALRRVTGYLHLTEIAAEVKGYAKALEGNQFVMDRRRG
jgi:diguanylate cyclase (GGDEF)-like protein